MGFLEDAALYQEWMERGTDMKALYHLLWLGIVAGLCMGAGGAGADTFHVSTDRGAAGNPGTYDRPTKTIQQAVDLATVTEGNDVITIEPGTYLENVLIIDTNRIDIFGQKLEGAPSSPPAVVIKPITSGIGLGVIMQNGGQVRIRDITVWNSIQCTGE
jgi:pectin methylesterase-like acyl-CoA thioesterase